MSNTDLRPTQLHNNNAPICCMTFQNHKGENNFSTFILYKWWPANGNQTQVGINLVYPDISHQIITECTEALNDSSLLGLKLAIKFQILPLFFICGPFYLLAAHPSMKDPLLGEGVNINQDPTLSALTRRNNPDFSRYPSNVYLDTIQTDDVLTSQKYYRADVTAKDFHFSSTSSYFIISYRKS